MAERLILGTVQFGLDYGINNTSGIPDEAAIHDILSVAHHNGICCVDTAEIYGKAVDCIGSFQRKTGLHFEINTKFIGTTIDVVEKELANNLEKLDVTNVNTYFYHTFSRYMSNRSINRGLRMLKENGMIREVGLSIYSNEEFEIAIDDPDIDVIQLPFNLLDNLYQRSKYFKLAKSKNKKIQVRSVFLQGLFFKDLRDIPQRLMALRPYLVNLHRIAAENDLSIESMCLQYAKGQADIDEIVIGIDNTEQLARNIHAIKEDLPVSIREEIDAIQVKEQSLLYPFNWQ